MAVLYGCAQNSYLRMLLTDPISYTLFMPPHLSDIPLMKPICYWQTNSYTFVKGDCLFSNQLKLSSTAQNPAFNGVFACKFKSAFNLKLNHISLLGIRVLLDMYAISFKQKHIL